MYDMPLIHALLLNRPPEWNIERAVPVWEHEQPVSFKLIFLACL